MGWKEALLSCDQALQLCYAMRRDEKTTAPPAGLTELQHLRELKTKTELTELQQLGV